MINKSLFTVGRKWAYTVPDWYNIHEKYYRLMALEGGEVDVRLWVEQITRRSSFSTKSVSCIIWTPEDPPFVTL